VSPGQEQPAFQTAGPLDAFEFPRTVRFDHAYWLSRCEGFRVDWQGGRGGTVEEVRFRSRHDRPDVLVVRVGRFRRRRLLVPADEVVSLSPRERRVLLSADPGRAHASP
jgi:hypothetical protein